LIQIQKYDDKRVLCVAQARKKEKKKKSENNEQELTHFSANVNAGLSFSKGKLIL